MSKGILNNRDKMIWDNTHKPEITDVVGVVDDEMDDLLEDHDDKVVDIVGDNMNDLLDAHDDKVVSIVGDNMNDLLDAHDDKVMEIVSDNASTVQQLAGDLSGIGTTAGVKVGKWDATHDIYAKRYTGTFPTADTTFYVNLESASYQVIRYDGYITRPTGIIHNVSNVSIYGNYDDRTVLQSAPANSEATYDFIMFYLVTITP